MTDDLSSQDSYSIGNAYDSLIEIISSIKQEFGISDEHLAKLLRRIADNLDSPLQDKSCDEDLKLDFFV